MARRNEFTPAGRPASPVPLALSRSVLAGAALIVLATAVAYLPSLSGGFILDDKLLLTDNRLIKAADGLYRFWCTTEATDYWPVSNTTLWLEWRLWGMHPAGYHVTNLVLHIVEALLIWSILRRLSIPGAFLGALLFAVHPVNVESVAWIAQRKTLMAMLFFLLSILCYLKTEPPSPAPYPGLSPQMGNRSYWLSLVTFVLAMLSKGSVVVLPPLLLGIIWWLRPLTKRDLVRVAPFFLFAVLMVAVNIWFQTRAVGTPIRAAGFPERLLGAGAVVWFYLYKAMLPINLAFIYPRWRIDTEQVRWWLPLLACAGVTGVLWWYRRRWSRAFLFAWGYFCVALVPVMGFTDVGFMRYSLVADHYQHIALIAVAALAAAGWDKWQRRSRGPARWMLNALAVAVGSVLTFLAWQQSGHYASALTLYRTALDKNPNSGLAHNNLGLALSESGRPQEAIEHYEQALRLKPDYPEAHNGLGSALAKGGQTQEAIEHYEQALRIDPDHPNAHYNLGLALSRIGRQAEAIEHFEHALRVKPNYPEAHDSLGNVLATTGRLQEAIEQYEQALRLKPGYPEAHYNLAWALAKVNRLPEAIEQYQQVVTLTPDYAEAWANLAFTYAAAGQSSAAIRAAQKTLEVARHTGQSTVVATMEKWLNSYRTDQPNPPPAPPSG